MYGARRDFLPGLWERTLPACGEMAKGQHARCVRSQDPPARLYGVDTLDFR